MPGFELVSPYSPSGDQPKAIENIVKSFQNGDRSQVLMGVTGSGKTFTMANVIKTLSKPTLILTHNKTLAAQLYQEFKSFFPRNAVEYFVSYYDYYQPEAYVVTTDTYIEKDAGINEEIEKLRVRASTSLLTRKDVIVVSSVSCIYGLGSPVDILEMMIRLKIGDRIERNALLRRLVEILYTRNDTEPTRGNFRARGDVIDVHPAYEDYLLRIELWGDEVEGLSRVHRVSGETLEKLDEVIIAPAKHYVTRENNMDRVFHDVYQELNLQLEKFKQEGKLLEAQRLQSRVKYDMEMLKETGYCTGIENYSRIIENRPVGSRPYTLIDFFGDDWLLIVDESHVTIPQIGGMFNGDRARKNTLVDYGFRLPCALDNRPMSFAEFEQAYPPSSLYVTATPGDYEMRLTGGAVVEQIIRPTGLLDPVVDIFPVHNQMNRILEEIAPVIERGERILITTLTKKMAEDLTDYLLGLNIKVRYMHSDIDTLQRSDIIRSLRAGEFDILVGINLLREGLDLPEVSMVIILDADKEGFLRSYRSLIQTMGRAARHVNGRVILFADNMTDSMKKAIDETRRRRILQESHNLEHGIIPRSTVRKLEDDLRIADLAEAPLEKIPPEKRLTAESADQPSTASERESYDLADLESRMYEAAASLNFEEAARLRDLIQKIKNAASAKKA